jgi:hypothetical protein
MENVREFEFIRGGTDALSGSVEERSAYACRGEATVAHHFIDHVDTDIVRNSTGSLITTCSISHRSVPVRRR